LRRLLRCLAAAGILTIATVAMAGTAQAAPDTPCTVGSVSQPFGQWGDTRNYALVPGGDFEGSLAGWRLRGATQVAGSETFGVTGAVGSASLELPPGAAGVAPPACVDVPQPDVRLFVRSASGTAQLHVFAVYNNGESSVVTPLGTVDATADWQPTPPLNLNQVDLGADGSAPVGLVFRASGGTMDIDDVFIDPHGRY
jgi:hypothetical protein